MTALARFVDALEAGDCRPRRGEARCPGHDDRRASLSYKEGQDGRVLVKCHAGCPLEQVLAPLGLEPKDLFEANGDGRLEIVATYDYLDENGELLFQVVRFAPKDFRQRKLDGVGGWVWKLGNTRRVLYRLPRVVEAVGRSEDIMVVEGEKDADALDRLGIAATCNPGGAGKWRSEYSETLRGAKVTIVADHDATGRDHANAVAEALRGVAETVDMVEPAVGKDMSDHLGAGRSIAELVEVSPRGDIPPDGAELLEEVKDFIGRFVVLPSEEVGDLLALWVLHTHAFVAAWATPYLRITSAAPSSGKTLLLEVLAAICRNGWHAINPSVAVLYRKIDRQQPTLLLDEMDNYPLDERRDALAVLNSGYKRGAMVDRCKENGDLESFNAFCPKAYAGLDRRVLVDTLLSRSITIRLEKRLASERVDMWIAPLTEPKAIPLRERCELWAAQNQDALALHEPALPDGLINREAEVWWALLVIADCAAGDWPERARRAAIELTAGGDDTDDAPDQVLLLLDIRDAFAKENTISTADLLAKLNALDESPWGARRRGEGLDARSLARMLRPFKIRPKQVRIGDRTAKGYHRDQFGDAFARHLPEGKQGKQGKHPAPGRERDVSDVSDVSLSPTPAREGDEETLGAAWERLECERGDAA
jgi:hypothetical protein